MLTVIKDGLVTQVKDPTAWLTALLGTLTHDFARRVRQVRVEGPTIYVETHQGVLVVMKIEKYDFSLPIQQRKYKEPIHSFRHHIELWDEAFKVSPAGIQQMLEQRPRRVIKTLHMSGGDKAYIGLGDLPGTHRDIREHIATVERQRRGEWLESELPLCPDCIKAGVGFARQDRFACRIHRWLDTDVYCGWSIDPNRPSRVLWPIKRAYIEEVTAKNVTVVTPVTTTNSIPTVLVTPVNYEEILSKDMTVEELRVRGNRYIHLYKLATELAEREGHRWTEDMRHWANGGLDKLKQFIDSLRRKLEQRLEVVPAEPVEKPPAPAPSVFSNSSTENLLIRKEELLGALKVLKLPTSVVHAQTHLDEINKELEKRREA